MDIYFDKVFLGSLPNNAFDIIDKKLERISQYSFLQFRRSTSCRKIKAVKDVFKFRFNDGDRIVFKYVHQGIRLIKYASHDKQIRTALNYNKIRDILTNGLIKWVTNAISSLLLNNHIAATTNTTNHVVEERLNCFYACNNECIEECLAVDNEIREDTSYIEDEIDEELEAIILQMAKQGILDNTFDSRIVDDFLDNNDIENAILFEEVLNLYEKKKFFEDNRDKFSVINITKGTSAKISLNDIRKAIDLFYEKTDYCIYPLFYASIKGTGCLKMLYTPTENKNDPTPTKENIISLISKRIGVVQQYSAIALTFLAFEKEAYVDFVQHNDSNVIVSNYEFTICPSKNTISKDHHVNAQLELHISEEFSIDGINGDKFALAKRYNEDDDKLLQNNLDFIFSNNN